MRAELAARYRAMAERFRAVHPDWVGRDPAGWFATADALEQGRPVVLPGSKLRGRVKGAGGRHFRLEVNDTLTEVVAVHDEDDTVTWVDR